MSRRRLAELGVVLALGTAAAVAAVAVALAIGDVETRWTIATLAAALLAYLCAEVMKVWLGVVDRRRAATMVKRPPRPARDAAVPAAKSVTAATAAKPAAPVAVAPVAAANSVAAKNTTASAAKPAAVAAPPAAPDPLWPKWPQPAAQPSTPVPWIDGGPADETVAEVWTWERARRPSYMYKLAESKRRQRLVGQLGGSYRIMDHNAKSAGYVLAERCGVAIPEIYGERPTIEAVDFDSLPDRVVLKTVSGSTNRGIYLLVRRGPGRFLDLMDSVEKTPDDIIASYRDFLDRSLVVPQLLMEELLQPRPDVAPLIDIPDDLKIYCFEERVVAIMQRRMNGTADRTQWRFKFWTADWRDLGPVKNPDRLDPSLEAPSGGDEVLAAARTVARELDAAFVRLDFYDTARGPVFGEVSPHPGPPEVWRADVDELLGREWELAEARLLARGRSAVRPTSS